jgi:hypothetical protein
MWNTGSVINHVSKIVGNSLPTSISGTNMTSIIEQETFFINQYATTNIDLTAIDEKYIPPLCDLVLSKIMLSAEMTQGGINHVSLGDLNVSQGNSSESDVAKQLQDNALLRLKELQRSVRFTRVIGGC